MVWQAQHRGSVSGYDVPYLVPEYIGNGGKCSDRNLHLRYAYVPYAVHTVLPESVPHELNQQTTDPRRDKMVVVYILLGILAVLLLYICFLAICSLCVDPKKNMRKTAVFTAHCLQRFCRCFEGAANQSIYKRTGEDT